MAFMGAGLITNIILDYLFLMVFKLGMFGAALATIIAEGIVALISIYYLFKIPSNGLPIAKNHPSSYSHHLFFFGIFLFLFVNKKIPFNGLK